ncbi:MAG: hypothetical protein C4305_08430, partial [Thermoleophilia bacterium]
TTVELARDAYGVVFADEETLAVDWEATEALREELRARPRGRSLTDYYADRGLVKVNLPTSIAGNREFGIE